MSVFGTKTMAGYQQFKKVWLGLWLVSLAAHAMAIIAHSTSCTSELPVECSL